MAEQIIVPIDVAALVVAGSPAANTGFAPPLTRFNALPYGGTSPAPFNSEVALNGPPLAPQSPDAGVRVHWAMPDSLMHATRPDGKTSASDGGWTFPALPDLWLVTRVARVSGKPDVVRSWVVDSRFAASTNQGFYNVGSSTIPWQNANDPVFQQPPFRYLGRAVPLDDWPRVAASGDHIDRLYAGSFGMVEVAAFYPNVINVFGIFDALGDVAVDGGAELCYAVTGWHSRAGDDPLAGRTLADAITKLKDLSWSVNVDAVTDPTDWTTAVDLSEAPAGTAYCGMVHSVKWVTPAAASPNKLTVAFGNTTSEALSALIVEAGAVASPTDADALEFNLHALLTSQLPVLADTAGQRLVTRQLHKQRFSPVTATVTWYARRSNDGADVSATLNDTLRAQLDNINSRQKAADTLRNQVQAQRWQVYADWLKYLEVKYGDNPAGLDPDQVAGFMEGADTIGGTVARPDAPLPAIEAAISSLTAAEGALKAALAGFPSPGGTGDDVYTLAQKPGEVFFQPSDPTLLMSGPDVVPALRYGGDALNDDGALACRSTSTLVSALVAPAGAVPTSSAARLDAQASPGLGATVDAGVLGGVTVALDFLLESVLLWPSFAAAKLAAKAGGDPSAWQGWLVARENAFLAAKPNDSSVYQGRKTSPVGIDAWGGNPWLPIMLHWEIDYWPTQLVTADAQQQPTLDPKLILGRLSDPHGTSLDSDATELTMAGALSAIPTTYLGINFITPHAGYAAFEKLAEYAAANPKSPLAELAAKVTAMPLLSQALTGFHDRFLLRRRTLQLDVRDPFADDDDDTVAFINRVVAAVATNDSHANTAAPMVKDSFCPVRAGSLGVKTISLVDAFGQYRTYVTQSNAISTVPARAVNPKRMYSGAAADAFMPPRISQPALLRFNWLAANSDGITTGTQPASTPICGWLVPNYLDASLVAYDTDGGALGSVAQVDGQVRWLAAPTRPNAFGETGPAPKNRHLLDFLNALIAKGTDYLNQFLDTLDRASASIQPLQHAQSAQLPVLVGQPLALVRGTLELDLMTPPAINNNWAAFEQDIKAATGGKTTSRTTNGHEAVKLPVLIGSVEDPDDGLLGFYLDPSFDTFYAIVPGSGGIATRTIGTVTVSVADGPVALSMIIDPRCDIHATTGYMPTQALRIPIDMFRDAFDNIAVTFLTAPVLAAAQADSATPSISLPLPLPGQQNGDWSWLSVKGANGGTRTIEEVKPVMPLKPDAAFSKPRYVLREGWLSLKGFEE